jgi:DNA-binding PucR family transcriptional regulator
MWPAGARPYDDAVDSDNPVVDRHVSAVASAVSAKFAEVSDDLWRDLIRNVPELRGDDAVVKLLGASVESNVTTLLHLLGHGLVPESHEAPAAALEYAGRLAQRGVSLEALVRAYRVGHGRFMTWCLDEVDRQVQDRAVVVPVVERLISLSFRYIDHISERMISAYQQERDHWLLSQNARRSQRVRTLLDDRRPDVDLAEAETIVGYRLRQHHLGLMSWVTEANEGGQGLARLDRLTTMLAETLGCRTRPLFVPCDEAAAWSWLPMGSTPEVDWEQVRKVVAERGAGARVTAGQLAPGLDGFRQTHQQALRAKDVANLARPGSQVTTFAETGPVALMLADLQATRGWIWEALGNLADDNEQAARLRETLQVFLAAGGSYVATAERLALHKNTVQYRVRKAEDAIGHSIEGHRSDVEMALRVCQKLGGPVLRSAQP